MLQDMYEEERTIVEPAGALELVGAEAYCKYHGLKDETVVAVTSGANMDSSTFRRVSLVANVDCQGEAMLAIFLPEKPDSFERLWSSKLLKALVDILFYPVAYGM